VNISPEKIIIVCILIFVSGFVDSIAGGGGLISLPAYFLTGIPVHNALATNKFSASLGTFIATVRFIRSGKIHFKSALISAAGALVGSFLGARLALAIDEKYLKYILVILLPIIAVFILTRKDFGEKDKAYLLSNVKIYALSAAAGFVIGAYDGFFGPGTGTFLILVFTGLIGFNLPTASGNTKIVNLASNVSALVTFIISGKVLFSLGIFTAICGILGNWVGSGLAVTKGGRIIKPMMVCVLCMLMAKIGYDLLV